ncbi:hypothetical protein [Flavobacterium sp. FlaQc-48]|uniref:hypothetical protein n=1 Tax=Flavobacterium sp. FlaQc-48 TaxID=3374181 RepID=UPI003757E682
MNPVFNKILSSILILLCLFSCKKVQPIFFDNDSHAKIHEEMDKISDEIKKFDAQLVLLYADAEKNPEQVIAKADSLLLVNSNEKDKYKSQIKKNIESSLNYLKAELYYKTGNYSQSIKELQKEEYHNMDYAAALAANYAKLKEFDKAKVAIDSIGKGFYIYDYAFGNYNEVIGNKTEALKIYSEIKNNKEIKHYAYYPLAVARLEELSKSNPKLLDEIYFPTQNPAFDIADSDNTNRNKIFKMIFDMPEAKKKAVFIFESPQTNDKDYYWVKVGEQTGYQPEDFKAEYSFFIYPKDFQIKYYDEKNNKVMSIEEWRKSK